ncbi:MAG: hypothetical protein IJ093_04365 [Bacilli bacterium]|nr:hypothetical protein [Bacilli bacterium]
MYNLNLNTKKQGKGKTITIIILILLLVCTSSYIAYNELYNNKKQDCIKTVKTEKQKTESLDVTSKEVTSLFNKLNQLSSAWTSEEYYGYLFKQDSINIKDMSDELKVAIGLYKEYLSCIENNYECVVGANDTNVGTTVIPSSKVKAVIEDIFGDVEYTNVSTKAFDCSGEYTYDKSKDIFTATAPACGYGGASYNTYDYRITKAYKEGNSLDMYIKVAFEYFDFTIETDENGAITKDNTRYIYSDFDKKVELLKIDDSAYDFNNILEDYGDKLPVYKIHFEKEKGNYHFKSIEKQ